MKKSMKKMLLTVLTFTMLLLMSFSAQAAKISARQAVVGVGATTTLKVKGTKKRVRWSSSNKSVASVSKKGVVTGRTIGTAKITGKVGKKKYTCTVTVRENAYYCDLNGYTVDGNRISTVPAKIFYRNGKLIMQAYVVNHSGKNVRGFINYSWKLYLGTKKNNAKLVAKASNQQMYLGLKDGYYGCYTIGLNPVSKKVLNLAAMRHSDLEEEGNYIFLN